MTAVTAYIGFGANMGDPIQQILDARRQLLEHAEVSNLISSSFYLTSPVGYQDQQHFINCVSSVDTFLSAHSLLDVLQQIENTLGRQRCSNNQNAPRLIDLDILLFGKEQLNDEKLVVPHPRLAQRLFTLEPLHEIAPALRWDNKASVSDILRQGHAEGLFDQQTIYRLT